MSIQVAYWFKRVLNADRGCPSDSVIQKGAVCPNWCTHLVDVDPAGGVYYMYTVCATYTAASYRLVSLVSHKVEGGGIGEASSMLFHSLCSFTVHFHFCLRISFALCWIKTGPN